MGTSIEMQPTGFGEARYLPDSSRLNLISAVLGIAFFGAGSGGFIAVNPARSPAPSSSGVVIRAHAIPAPEMLIVPIGTSERLLFVKRELSLNMRQLADALLVSRPRVYSWLREDSTPRKAQLKRLKSLNDVAMYWKRMSNTAIGRYATLPISGADSVVDMLVQKRLEMPRIQTALMLIKNAMNREALRKLSSGYRSTAEIAREKGFEPVSEDAKAQRVANASRRAASRRRAT